MALHCFMHVAIRIYCGLSSTSCKRGTASISGFTCLRGEVVAGITGWQSIEIAMASWTGVWQGECRSLLQSAHWAREEECAFCQPHDMLSGDVVLEPSVERCSHLMKSKWVIFHGPVISLLSYDRIHKSLFTPGHVLVSCSINENFVWRWNWDVDCKHRWWVMSTGVGRGHIHF